jgi:hypothetical protein
MNSTINPKRILTPRVKATKLSESPTNLSERVKNILNSLPSWEGIK